VDGSFTTWIVTPPKSRLGFVGRGKAVLANHPEATEENNLEAWEALYGRGFRLVLVVGEGHSSNQDAIFAGTPVWNLQGVE